MTWSYSGDPSASDIDAIRFWSQLTDSNNERLSNEEITFIATQEDSNKGAGAACCEILATKYASEADIVAGANGELAIKMSQLSAQFAARGKAIRDSSATPVGPWTASISISEKEAQEDDTDRVEPAFSRDKFATDGSLSGNVQDWNNDGSR